MSTKNTRLKLKLFNTLKQVIENTMDDLLSDSQEIDMNDYEAGEYEQLVRRPLEELLDSITLFTTNVENGIYDQEEGEEDE